MCVIDVTSTSDLASTMHFYAHRPFLGQFGRFKKGLVAMKFQCFEIHPLRQDRRVLFTHASFRHMIFDHCNPSVLPGVPLWRDLPRPPQIQITLEEIREPLDLNAYPPC